MEYVLLSHQNVVKLGDVLLSSTQRAGKAEYSENTNQLKAQYRTVRAKQQLTMQDSSHHEPKNYKLIPPKGSITLLVNPCCSFAPVSTFASFAVSSIPNADRPSMQLLTAS